MFADAEVKLLYPPPYSPDFNPIEEFFAELKDDIKKAWSAYEENPDQGFMLFFGGVFMRLMPIRTEVGLLNSRAYSLSEQSRKHTDN